MRQVAICIETTGLSVSDGHRVIEFAAVELSHHELTGTYRHWFCNPGRPVDASAQALHGLSFGFLAGQSPFAKRADELLGFVAGAQAVHHNAPFDLKFIDRELELADRPPLSRTCHSVLDTWSLARARYPGKPNTLRALCDRLAVDDSAYLAMPPALMDAHCLAEAVKLMSQL